MSMKPRLEQDNKGIPNTVNEPHANDEGTFEIPGTVTCKHPVENSKLTPNTNTAPKTFGN